MRKNYKEFLLLQSFLAMGFFGLSVETGFAVSQDELAAARSGLRLAGSRAAQEIQTSTAAAPMKVGTPPSFPGAMPNKNAPMKVGTPPPFPGAMPSKNAPMKVGTPPPFPGAMPSKNAPMKVGTPPPFPGAMPMKRGAGSVPVVAPAKGGLPPMNTRAQKDELAAARAGLMPTPMRIGTPPPPPGRAVMGPGGKLVKAEEPQDEFVIEDEASMAQEEAQPTTPPKKKGFFGSMASSMKKGMQKASATVKKQFAGKCIPGHIPESEEERIANENPMQQATRQMREQAMMAAGQMAAAGSAAVTARTQQGIDKATGAMTKQIARIAPKPRPAPAVVPPVVMEEEFVLEEPVQEEDIYAQYQEEALAPEAQGAMDEYAMDPGTEGVDPNAYTLDQGEVDQAGIVDDANPYGDGNDPYAVGGGVLQEEYLGNPYEEAGDASAYESYDYETQTQDYQ